MIDEKIGYSYNDLRIVPATISDIESRSECKCTYDNGKLPIFTAPMSTVVNDKNLEIWFDNGITPIIPRNMSVEFRYKYCQLGYWAAFSLKEFEYYFITNVNALSPITYKVCVDIANGHMKSMYEKINTAKELAKKSSYKLIVMAGNIANPNTYEWICKHAKVDYIRLSIGTGSGCTSSSNVGIHYPIATLIDECKKIQNRVHSHGGEYTIDIYDEEYISTEECMSRPKLIADGGIRNYDDVIKALALGADWVMIGSVFASLFESAATPRAVIDNSHYMCFYDGNGDIYYNEESTINIYNSKEEDKRNFIKNCSSLNKEFYGMSTKKAQRLINKNVKLKTSEGCTKIIPVTHTVAQWTENMVSYLKSAMSYTNCKSLTNFIGNVTLKVQSNATQFAVNK